MLPLLWVLVLVVQVAAQNKTEFTQVPPIGNVSDWNLDYEYGAMYCVNDPEHAFFFDWYETWWSTGPAGAASGGTNHGIGIQFGKLWIEQGCLKEHNWHRWWDYKTIQDIAHNDFCGCNHGICLDCQYSNFNSLKDGDWVGRLTSPTKAMGCHRSIGGSGVSFRHGVNSGTGHTHAGVFTAGVGIECRTNW